MENDLGFVFLDGPIKVIKIPNVPNDGGHPIFELQQVEETGFGGRLK
jgi:hypothetical protein